MRSSVHENQFCTMEAKEPVEKWGNNEKVKDKNGNKEKH